MKQGMLVYRHIQKTLTENWLRVGWSLSETFDQYLNRSRAGRILLHEALSEYMEDVYGPPQKQAKKIGM